MPLVDLSHAVEAGMQTYPGLPGPVICDFLSREASRSRYAPGTEFQIGKIELVANTGTYVDSPFHRFDHGKDLAALPLERLADLELLVAPLRHAAILHRASLPDRRHGPAIGRARRRLRGNRLTQYRRYQRRRPAGPHPAPGSGDPGWRALYQLGGTARRRRAAARRAGEDSRDGHLSGARLRHYSLITLKSDAAQFVARASALDFDRA